MQDNKATYKRQFAGHVDWLNATALCEDINFVVTASSDTSLKVWTLSKGQLAATLQKVRNHFEGSTASLSLHLTAQHDDYVKAVRYAPATRHFASGGLDGRVVVWDISSMKEVTNAAVDDKGAVREWKGWALARLPQMTSSDSAY